ncbi:MAG: imidazoleglycerol-phosphate dehydratase HisB [Angelakisella sp.]
MTAITRKTRETDITVELDIYGDKQREISTGVGFFDHMLSSFALHSGMSLLVLTKGDLNVDCHHTIEDTGIVLGQALSGELKDKSAIARFGTAYVPMDEALAFASIDISGRAFSVCNTKITAPMIGQYDTQMTPEFFRALAVNGGITLHNAIIYGENMHHITEALFKATARALKEAMAKTGSGTALSTKGVL